jgi:hypothetical protein
VLNPAPALPRLIDFSPGIWPPRNVDRITHPGPCAHCGEEIAMYHSYLGGYDLAHTGTERSRCNTDVFHIAAYLPTCPACGGHELTTNTTDPWADITTCPCGWTDRRSLGD